MIELNIPKEIIIGDSISWVSNLSDYSSTFYRLTWSLRGETALNLVALPLEEYSYTTAITGISSSQLIAGIYYYQAFISLIATSERLTLGSGTIDVIANLSDEATPFDGRTSAKKMLEAVDVAIQTILEGGAVQSYSIKGRSLSRMSMSELVSLRSQLRIEVGRENAAEKISQGLGDPRRLYVRFN